MRRIAVLAAVPVVLVGCGGSSSSSSNSARSEFVARANGVCRGAQEKAKPLVTRTNRLDPKSLDAAVALLNTTANDLAAIKPPADLRAGYQRFLALASKEIAVLARLALYVHERNLARIRSLAPELNGHAVNDQARKLGLSVCAQEVA